MPYKALRVPIALLHQKCYNTAQRLPKLRSLHTSSTDSQLESIREKFIISNVVTVPNKHVSTFSETPYLRRFYYEVGRNTKCRVCGKTCTDAASRADHIACYRIATEVIKKLKDDEVCAICEVPYDSNLCIERYQAPVCCEPCLKVWESMNPDSFEFYLAVVQGLDNNANA